MTGITKIVENHNLGRSPAAISRRTGVLHINPGVFWQLPPEQRLFVILHEMGHRNLNTRSELAADAYAARLYFKRGLPLSQSVLTLTRSLDWSNPDHRERAIRQLQRAQKFDEMQHFNNIAPQITDPDLDYWFPFISKAARERREQNQANRDKRRADRNTRRNLRTESKAESRLNRSNREDSGIMGTLGSVVGGIGGALLGIPPQNQRQNFDQDFPPAPMPPPRNNNTMIIIAVVVLVLIVVAFFVFKKK